MTELEEISESVDALRRALIGPLSQDDEVQDYPIGLHLANIDSLLSDMCSNVERIANALDIIAGSLLSPTKAKDT
jgi:hypothetical protein